MLHLKKPLVAFVCLFFLSIAQSDGQAKFNLDLGGGLTKMHGDIKSPFQPVGNIGVKYLFTPNLGIQANVKKGRFASESDPYGRKYENDYYETTLNFEANLNNLLIPDVDLGKFSIFGNVGVGLIHNHARDIAKISAMPEGENYNKRESHSGSNVIFPVEGSIEYQFSNSFSIYLNTGYSLTYTDKIDNYAIDHDGNEAKDLYSYYMLGVSLNFNKYFQFVD